MAVAVVLSKFFTFSNLMLKCTVVLAVSFAIYEAGYILSLPHKHVKAKKTI